MNSNQFEILERAQSARITAEAHGYAATAEALGEILALLAQDFGCLRSYPLADPDYEAPAEGVSRKLFQAVS